MTVKRKELGHKTVTCSAPVNIAVIKYWGKRDSKLMLPTNSSLSLTLNQDDLRTTTTIKAVSDLDHDTLWLNGEKQDSNAKRFVTVLSQARQARKEMERKDKSLEKISNYGLVIASVNNFPTAAGLASSASGFACLTYALAELYELDLTVPEISRIARMGSGSACRSLYGGYVKWEMGVHPDGSDSMAIQVATQDEWPNMEALILVVSDARKDTGSTEGMQLTVETSPLLQHRIENVVPQRMIDMEAAIKENDFDKFAEITMADSNQFHAVCLDTYPPIFYLNDISRGIIRLVTEYNNLFLEKDEDGQMRGYRVAYTFDAGPNAVLYFNKKYAAEIVSLVDHYFPNAVSGSAKTDYYGRATQYLGKADVKEVISKLKYSPWPKNSLKRLISTSVGDGPQVLSTDDELSLLKAGENVPKTIKQ